MAQYHDVYRADGDDDPLAGQQRRRRGWLLGFALLMALTALLVIAPLPPLMIGSVIIDPHRGTIVLLVADFCVAAGLVIAGAHRVSAKKWLNVVIAIGLWLAMILTPIVGYTQALFLNTYTKIPSDGHPCTLVMRESQFLLTASSDVLMRRPGQIMLREYDGYVSDDAAFLVHNGRYHVEWNGDVASIRFDASASGGITPGALTIDCAKGWVSAQTAPTRPAPSTSSTPSPTPGAGSTNPEPATCALEQVNYSWSEVDAALGRRFLALTVTNCTKSILYLPEHPTVVATDEDQKPLALTEELKPAARSLELAPGETSYLNLTWRSNGRCELGAQKLTVNVDGTAVETPAGSCLQLGAEGTAEIEFGWGVKKHG